MKKLLAIAAMTMALMGAMVINAGATNQTLTVDGIGGGSNYETIDAALTAASNGDTIQLTVDIIEDVEIDAEDEIILDLNGHKITNSTATYTIANYGTLEIKDSGTTGTVVATASNKAALYNEGTATVLDGTFYRITPIGYTIQNKGTSLTLGGNIEVKYSDSATSTSALVSNGYYYTADGVGAVTPNMYITGGSFENNGEAIVIKNDEYGIMEISGGTFTGHSPLQNWNKITINGGTFISQSTGTALGIYNDAYSTDGIGELKIYGGTFNCDIVNGGYCNSAAPAIYVYADITIEGDLKTRQNNSYVTGFIIDENGSVLVTGDVTNFGSITNNGTLQWNGTYSDTGTFSIGSTWYGSYTGTLTNNGTIVVNDAAALTTALNVGGAVVVNSAITMSGSSTFVLGTTLTIASDATLTIASGATLTGEGSVVGTDATSVLVLEADTTYGEMTAGTYVWDNTGSEWDMIYTITFEAGSGTCATATALTGVDGKLATIPTASRSSCRFNGWTGSDTDTYASTSTVFSADTTLTASYTKYATTTTTTEEEVVEEVVEETTTEAAEDGTVTTTVATEVATADGTTAATVTDDVITSAIESAVTEADGETAYVAVAVESGDDATAVEVALTTNAVTAIADSDVEALVITTDLAVVEISSDVLTEIAAQATGSDIVVVVDHVDAEVLTEEQTAVIGDDALVVDLTVLSDGQIISSFGGHTVTVSIPYTLKDGESAESIVVWYVGDDGMVTAMETVYNEETGMATFKTTHFSVYVIVHDTNVYVDVTVNDWFYDAVLWAVEAEITTGITETTFEPTTTCTRAEVVTFLYRLAGQPAVETERSFSDVGDAWYTDAVLWAVDAGVTTGTGEDGTTFSPDATCTRAEVVTFLYRYAGEPEVEGENTFADVAADAWYANAVIWATENGITTGTGDGFSPDATCTRAEVVTFLSRYVAQ